MMTIPAVAIVRGYFCCPISAMKMSAVEGLIAQAPSVTMLCASSAGRNGRGRSIHAGVVGAVGVGMTTAGERCL